MRSQIKAIVRRWSLAIVALPALLSCSNSFIYDEDNDCHMGAAIRFVYDYNMEFANSFHNQVECLTVFVYDYDGRFVARNAVVGDALKNENYRMNIDLPEGTYTFIAYGGMECEKGSFEFNSNPKEGDRMEDVNNRLPEHQIGEELHPLFYGKFDGYLEVKSTDTHYKEITVYMIKDTNHIRVLLQQVDGEILDHNEFDFRITADNALMRHDNKVVLGNQYSFTPWINGNETPGELSGGKPASVAWGEFSIPRLALESEVANLESVESYEGPRLEINYKADNRKVVSIPLLKYLLLCKPAGSTKAAAMSDQEFLDRESRYNLFFFLDRHYQWVSVQIEVESWVVRVNNIES